MNVVSVDCVCREVMNDVLQVLLSYVHIRLYCSRVSSLGRIGFGVFCLVIIVWHVQRPLYTVQVSYMKIFDHSKVSQRHIKRS